MKIYVIEYLAKGFLGGIISFFSHKKYSHTAVFLQGEQNYFCELDATDAYKREPDFHCYAVNMDIKTWLKSNPESDRTEAFEIPFDFTQEQITKCITWWQTKQSADLKYGYAKLLDMILVIPISKVYYKITGKQYNPILFKREDVCSMAAVESVLFIGYEILPGRNIDTVIPGDCAEKLKDYKV